MNAPQRLARDVDRIDSSARFTQGQADLLNTRFADADTSSLLDAVLTGGLAGRVAIVSSFGAESAVLLHQVAQVDQATPVLFLDTLKHFPETLAYRDTLIGELGLTDLRILTPDETELAEAGWFTREDVEAALAGRDDAPIVAPTPHTIAHQLFRWWIAQ